MTEELYSKEQAIIAAHRDLRLFVEEHRDEIIEEFNKSHEGYTMDKLIVLGSTVSALIKRADGSIADFNAAISSDNTWLFVH